MKFTVLEDADAVAREGARVIAAEARAVCAARGRIIMALSGGRTPWQMLRALASENLPWECLHVFQVDERILPSGHQDRNLTHLRASLVDHALLLPENLYAMPVQAEDLATAAKSYARSLAVVAGTPPVLDLVHLGLGADGHTASLVPGDAALDVTDCDVALTGVYQGRRRITLTYPMINRARKVLWLVTGAEKSSMLARLRSADVSIPAGRVQQDEALVLADRAAVAEEAMI